MTPCLPCYHTPHCRRPRRSVVRSSHHSHHARTKPICRPKPKRRKRRSASYLAIFSLLIQRANSGSLHPVPPTSFALMRARMFREEDRHGAVPKRRCNSPPQRGTSSRATQTPPQAARSCGELPRDPVYAAEAVSALEGQPSCHGVSSSAGAALFNPFWGI